MIRYLYLKKTQTKQKNHLIHYIEADQHRKTRKYKPFSTDIHIQWWSIYRPVGYHGLLKGPRTIYQEWMSFSPVYFLHFLCWTHLLSLSTGPRKTADFYPLISSLYGWSLSFQIVHQAPLETQFPLPQAFLFVFSGFCLLLLFQTSLWCICMHLWKSSAGCGV